MDIRELESFCTAASLRSFSRAAKTLNLGQPTVTKHIRKLEAELGKELFQRNERPVQLTAAGISLLRLAAPLVEGLRSFSGGGKAVAEVAPVTIACAHGFMNEMLLRAVQAFRDRAPHCPLRIRGGTKPEVIAMVTEGSVDLAITPNPDLTSKLAFQPMSASERVLITPLEHPLLARPLRSLSDIAIYPLVFMGYRTLTRTLLEDAFKAMKIPYEIAVELDSMDMVKRYVELGLGVGVGHKAALDPVDYRNMGIISLSAFLPSELVGVATRRDRQLSAQASDFVAVLSSTLKSAEAAKPMSLVGRKRQNRA